MYSTCSIAVEENEEVVDYVLKRRHVQLVETGLKIESKYYSKFEQKHFHHSIRHCVRVFPHIHNLDGFFLAKLKKLKDGEKKREENEDKEVGKKQKIQKKKKTAKPSQE